MGKPFRDLSQKAQWTIVDCMLDNIDISTIDDSVKEEIRAWATVDQRDLDTALFDSPFATFTEALNFIVWAKENTEHLSNYDINKLKIAEELVALYDRIGTC